MLFNFCKRNSEGSKGEKNHPETIIVKLIKHNNNVFVYLFQIFQVLEHPVEKDKLATLQDLVSHFNPKNIFEFLKLMLQ